MTAGAIAGGLAQLGLIVALSWAIGGALLPRLGASLRGPLGAPERLLLGIAGFFACAVLAMVGHIVTGGALFGVPGVVPVLAASLLFTLRRHLRPAGIEWAPVLVAVAMLGLIFISPAFSGGSGIRTGDPPWHLGWSEQLLHGEPVPTGPAPEFGRNAYPWGWHAAIATSVRLVPGTTPLVAHEALHALIVLAIPLAAACIARRFDRRAGWAAAAASAVGGWAWLWLSEPDFVTTPSEARHGADLVVASPNSAYELFPPALPREFGLVLLGAAAVALLHALDVRSKRSEIAAGFCTGFVGLVSVPLFVTALVWSLGGVAVAPRGARARLARALFLPAAGVFALWAGPVVTSYARFGGFVDITPRLGVEWPVLTALSSWGLLAPLSLGGLAFVIARRSGMVARGLAVFSAGSAVLIALAAARSEFDWNLAGNATLLHQGRMWPPAHLLAAALAGIALARLGSWVAARSRELAVAGGAVLLGAGLGSPIAASVHLAHVIEERSDGYSYARPDLDAGSFVRRTADHLGPDSVVRVDGSDELGFMLFQLSGVRLADYDDPRLERNDLRIRYADLAHAWDERMAGRGFEPDFEVVSPADAGDRIVLESGRYAGADWVLVPI